MHWGNFYSVLSKNKHMATIYSPYSPIQSFLGKQITYINFWTDKTSKTLGLSPVLFLFAIILLLVIIVIILAYIYRRKSIKLKKAEEKEEKSETKEEKIFSSGDLEVIARFKPRIIEKKIEKIVEKIVEKPVPVEDTYSPRDIELSEIKDYKEFIKTMTDKYRLLNLTLVDSEGLVILSSAEKPEKMAEQAASLAEQIFNNDNNFAEFYGSSFKFIFPIEYEGHKIIVMGNSEKRVSADIADMIKKDLGFILPTLIS